MTEPVSQVASLIADCQIAQKRLTKTIFATADEARLELLNNTYPLMEAVLEQITEVDQVVQEMVDQGDSFVDDELAQQIAATIALGGALAEAFKTLLPAVDDVAARKRFEEIITAFEQSANATMIAVMEAAGEEEDDGDDDIQDAEIEDAQKEGQ